MAANKRDNNAPKGKHTLPLERYTEIHESGGGMCIECGEEAEGVEPDARKVGCSVCLQPKVYGAEELLVMGLVV